MASAIVTRLAWTSTQQKTDTRAWGGCGGPRRGPSGALGPRWGLRRWLGPPSGAYAASSAEYRYRAARLTPGFLPIAPSRLLPSSGIKVVRPMPSVSQMVAAVSPLAHIRRANAASHWTGAAPLQVSGGAVLVETPQPRTWPRSAHWQRPKPTYGGNVVALRR